LGLPIAIIPDIVAIDQPKAIELNIIRVFAAIIKFLSVMLRKTLKEQWISI
jgi:hypothetical protein